jgi:hypothetical protein
MTALMADAHRLLDEMTAPEKPPPGEMNRLLDGLTRLVRLWEQRAEADNAARCGSPTWVEQKAWARARSNDAMELKRLIAEFRPKKNPAVAGSVSPPHADRQSA